jgi:hypothetical protein
MEKRDHSVECTTAYILILTEKMKEKNSYRSRLELKQSQSCIIRKKCTENISL